LLTKRVLRTQPGLARFRTRTQASEGRHRGWQPRHTAPSRDPAGASPADRNSVL